MDTHKYFELKPREEVIQVIRSSIVPKIGVFVLLVIWFLLPFFFLFAMWRGGTPWMIVFIFWLVSATVFLWRAYFMWSRTIFVITNMRVIDHDQKGFFNKIVTEARYDQIDEVSYRVKGILPTIFRYGVIALSVHGSSADLQIANVHSPSRAADLINELRVGFSGTSHDID